VMAVV